MVVNVSSVNSKKQGNSASMERQKVFREDLKKQQAFEVVQTSSHDAENYNSLNKGDNLAN